jgi:tetraacyldisaccharide-1-P 4'-kinase
MLRDCGLRMARTVALRDHREIPGELLRDLPGPVLMTEKDALKCLRGQPGLERLWAVQLRLDVDPAFIPWLLARVERAASRSPDGFTSA